LLKGDHELEARFGKDTKTSWGTRERTRGVKKTSLAALEKNTKLDIWGGGNMFARPRKRKPPTKARSAKENKKMSRRTDGKKNLGAQNAHPTGERPPANRTARAKVKADDDRTVRKEETLPKRNQKTRGPRELRPFGAGAKNERSSLSICNTEKKRAIWPPRTQQVA